jgi:transcription elongation factor GreA-like protein
MSAPAELEVLVAPAHSLDSGVRESLEDEVVGLFDQLRERLLTLDLAHAQHEIASNWIEAYKRYFHTDHPLAEHR